MVAGQALDLTRRDSDETLDGSAALTLISSKVAGVFDQHPLQPARTAAGEWRINPLFDVTDASAQLQATLRFPSSDYEYEYSACREYLPESVSIDATLFRALQAGTPQPSLDELIRRKVLIDVPAKYF